MRPLIRRVLGYGAATCVLSGLSYFGFVYQLPPDPEHAVLQAEIKLRFATRLPAHRDDGTVVAARETLIADAVRYLDEAERLAPPTATTVEYRAYVAYLRGDARAAAAGYTRASALAAEPEASDGLALSAARMLALAGDDPAALARLDARLPALAPALAAAANLERARIFHRRGSQAEALAAARAVLSNDAASGQDLVGAGEILEAGGDLATAVRAYQQAQPTYPIASYLAARLKVLGGDVDNALEMLERAVTDTGGAVRALVERDLALWQPCAGSERFQMLFPDLETARPGR